MGFLYMVIDNDVTHARMLKVIIMMVKKEV